jgi:hypothetical protein
MAEIILASKLHFFDAADRTWSDAHVLPLLDWADPSRARRTWDGYLRWGRWNDHLLDAGLLTAYLHLAVLATSVSVRVCCEPGGCSREPVRGRVLGLCQVDACGAKFDVRCRRFRCGAGGANRVDHMG